MHLNRRCFLAALSLATLPLGARTSNALDESKLETAARAARAGIAEGRIGGAVRDLSTGRTWSVNGSARFPMQSVYKLPIAVAVLRRVDLGELSLDKRITLSSSDLSVQWSPIARDFRPPTQSFSIRELIQHAVATSDNTASDVLLELAGGPGAVTRFLRGFKIHGISVDRSERTLQPEALGLPAHSTWPKGATVDDMIAGLSDATQRRALKTCLLDTRDTASPLAMVEFLGLLAGDRLLSPEITAVILGVMESAATGANRLKAGLPPGARLANKTGTARDVLGIGPATNDVRIIKLKGGRRLAVAVFISGSSASAEFREAAIASFASAACADFL